MKKTLHTWGVAVAACLPFLTPAQTAKAEAPRAAPQLIYQSAFVDYKPYQDSSPANWRTVNDDVARSAGDHGEGSMSGMPGMGQMRAPKAAAPATPATPASTKPAREHRQMHGGKP